MNLYEQWTNVHQDMTKLISKGDVIKHNGKRFSDSHCFEENNVYTVLSVDEFGFSLKTKFEEGEGETDVYVHPDGFESFEL